MIASGWLALPSPWRLAIAADPHLAADADLEDAWLRQQWELAGGTQYGWEFDPFIIGDQPGPGVLLRHGSEGSRGWIQMEPAVDPWGIWPLVGACAISAFLIALLFIALVG